MIVHVQNFETCKWCEYLAVSNCFMFQKVVLRDESGCLCVCCCCCCCSLGHDVTARTHDASTAGNCVFLSIFCCPAQCFRGLVSGGVRGGGMIAFMFM